MVFYYQLFLGPNYVLIPDIGAELAKFRNVMRTVTETIIRSGITLLREVSNPGSKINLLLPVQTSLSRKKS